MIAMSAIRTALLAMAMMASALVPGGARASEPAQCPQSIDPARFADEETFYEWNQVMDDHGPRPTGSPAQEAYIDWLADAMRALPGMEVTEVPELIDRQLEESATLRIQVGSEPSESIRVARAVPYTKPAPGSVTGQLVDVPMSRAIAEEDVEGKVVIRNIVPGSLPQLAFLAVTYYVHDPDRTFNWFGNYERDWIGALQIIADLEGAEEAGAAGLIFVHGFPHEQVEGIYLPYPGVHYDVTGLYVGADEGARLRQSLTQPGGAQATLTMTATRGDAVTRNLIATLPGLSEERIVISSHTDGMNAVWDNGPVSMLALAEYFSALPLECRARTLEFSFTTGHLYLSKAGGVRHAHELDDAYDDGTVAFVVVLEHLGAREFSAVSRGSGLPGRRLQLSGRSELFAAFVVESPVLVNSLIGQVRKHDLRRTFVLRGADAPEVRFPPHKSYGGEGGHYRDHLIPTVAAITGPWTLFSPSFTMDELLDVGLMRRQTLAFGDLILEVQDVPRQVLAGADTVYRQGRALTQ